MNGVVGYVISRSTPRRVSFVALRGSKISLGEFYTVPHPWKDTPVFLRAKEIYSINEEVDLGRAALIATSSGLISDYSDELEYIVAECEVLGYRDPLTGKIRGLEAPPPTLAPVSRPSILELSSFLSVRDHSGLPVKIGRIKGTSIPFHLDLASVAKGHMFVTGMTRSGKSVTGDSVVVIYDATNGRYFLGPVRKFVDSFLPPNKREGVVDLSNQGFYTISLDRGMTPTWGKIKYAYRHVNDKDIYEIRTSTGRTLRVTEDHSLIVSPDGGNIVVVTPKKLAAMRKKYLIVPRGVGLKPPKINEDLIYMDRLIGIALAQGIPGRWGKEVWIFDKNVADPARACEEAGVEYEILKGVVIAKSDLLMDGISRGLASILNLPETYVHFTGTVLYPRINALREFLIRKMAPKHDVKSMERIIITGEHIYELSTLLSLIGVTVVGHSDNGLIVDELTLQMALSELVVDGNSKIYGQLIYEKPKKVLQKAYVNLEEVVEVKKVATTDRFVYDLEVDPTHSFLANGAFVHNSSFIASMVSKAQTKTPRPRFLILDRRGEYLGLSSKGAVIYNYSAFLPKHGLSRPRDIAKKLGYRQGTLSYRLLLSAAEETMSQGDEPELDVLIKSLRKIAREMRIKSSLVADIESRLKRELSSTRGRGLGLDIVKEVRKHPLVIVDFSTDTYYEDQFLAVREIVRRLVRHAVDRRSQGDFALIVVIEEAQYLVPEKGYNIVGDPYEAGAAHSIIEAISQAGGYNLGFVIVTQRPAYVSKSVISQTNTVVAFRLRNGNDQEAIMKYTEVDDLSSYLPSLSDHEALIWGMASPISFPIEVEVEVVSLPSKAVSPPDEAWRKMG